MTFAARRDSTSRISASHTSAIRRGWIGHFWTGSRLARPTALQSADEAPRQSLFVERRSNSARIDERRGNAAEFQIAQARDRLSAPADQQRKLNSIGQILDQGQIGV